MQLFVIFEKILFCQVLETFETKIFAFRLANHLWLDFNPTLT